VRGDVLNSIILFVGVFVRQRQTDSYRWRDRDGNFHVQYFIVLYYVAQTMIFEFPLPKLKSFCGKTRRTGGSRSLRWRHHVIILPIYYYHRRRMQQRYNIITTPHMVSKLLYFNRDPDEHYIII